MELVDYRTGILAEEKRGFSWNLQYYRIFSRYGFSLRPGFAQAWAANPCKSAQPHCCRLLKTTPWLLCLLGEFEDLFQTPGTGLGENPYR